MTTAIRSENAGQPKRTDILPGFFRVAWQLAGVPRIRMGKVAGVHALETLRAILARRTGYPQRACGCGNPCRLLAGDVPGKEEQRNPAPGDGMHGS